MTPGWLDWSHAAVESEGCVLSILLVLVSGEASYLVEKHLLEPSGHCPQCHCPSS